ncbi:MAG: DUF427 domain-containing protein [Rubrobacteraceae bacterium]
MSLTMSTGPFGPKRDGEFNFDTSVLKPHTLYFEGSPKRARAVFGGEVVADSRRAKLLFETGMLPVYYFPQEDVRMDLMESTDHTTHCPFKGDASYWTIRVGDEVAENALWGYPEPNRESGWLAGYVAFYADEMDKWLEEDEEIIGHPHDPYHRVDVLQSSRRVKVKVDGETIAETTRPKMLFETNLPPRYYVPPEDIRTDLLAPSETKTVCPYKGVASHWSIKVSGERTEDAVWSYPEPLPEAERVKDHFCFYEGKASVEVE